VSKICPVFSQGYTLYR